MERRQNTCGVTAKMLESRIQKGGLKLRKRRISELGIAIKKRLAELNMTQRQLAERIGTSEAYLNLIIYGERSGDKYLEHIESVLNINIKKTA